MAVIHSHVHTHTSQLIHSFRCIKRIVVREQITLDVYVQPSDGPHSKPRDLK